MRRGDDEIWLDGLDLVVPTRPLVPASELGEVLRARGEGPAVHEAGDCVQPRTAFEAVQEGAVLGHRL